MNTTAAETKPGDRRSNSSRPVMTCYRDGLRRTATEIGATSSLLVVLLFLTAALLVASAGVGGFGTRSKRSKTHEI